MTEKDSRIVCHNIESNVVEEAGGRKDQSGGGKAAVRYQVCETGMAPGSNTKFSR